MMGRTNFVVAAAGVALFFSGFASRAQTPKPPASQPIPIPIAYHMFFRHVNFLIGKAAENEKAGISGIGLRNYYQTKLGLTLVENTALVNRAALCEKDVAAQDAAAKKFIEQYRRDNAAKFVALPPPPPPPPPEIAQMQAQRTTIIQGHLAQLKTDLGPAGSHTRLR